MMCSCVVAVCCSAIFEISFVRLLNVNILHTRVSPNENMYVTIGSCVVAVCCSASCEMSFTRLLNIVILLSKSFTVPGFSRCLPSHLAVDYKFSNKLCSKDV